MIKNILILLMISIIGINFIFGQNQNATTETGKKVILSPDGTWKYFEENKNTSNKDSSDCENWIYNSVDRVTGSSTIAALNKIIVSKDDGATGFGIFMIQSSKGGIILAIQVVGAGNCIDEGSKINILFDDNTRLELKNDGNFNCKGEATLYFGDIFGKKKELLELKTKKISTMRVWTNDSYLQRDFTEENKNEFYHIINCLSK